MEKVKVDKELFDKLKYIEEKDHDILKIIIKEKLDGYIYESEKYSFLNNIELNEMYEIYFNGYELEEDLIKENEILNNVNDLLNKQTSKGLKKYNKTVDENDYSIEEWIDHASEEIIDTLVYLMCIKQKLKDR